MAAIATADEFLALYEDFSVIDPTQIQTQIDFVDRNYCLASFWKSNPVARKDAVLLLTAHFGYLKWFQSAHFVESTLSISSGGKSSQLQAMDDHYKTTMYGQQYLELRKRVSIPHTGFAFG